jgi:hypothetical protein
MAQTTETILLQVDVVANTTRLTELRKELLANQESLAKYNQAAKDGRLSFDDLAAAEQRLKADSANLSQEIKVLTAANAAQVKASQAEAGSIEQLRAQLALGTAEYNKLSAAERDSTEAGQKLQASNKALSDNLKQLEKAVGDTRRNVGNYNEGIKDVNVVNSQLAGGFRTAIDKGLAPFRNEIDKGAGLLGKFKSGTDIVKTGLSSIKGAGEAGSLGLKAIAGGIALTGIGLFVIAISAVVAYFTQSAEGGKALAGVLGGLGGVLQVATDLVLGLGKAIVYAVTHPIQAIKDFGTTLGNALLHPIDTAKALASGVGNIATRVKDAYEASSQFAARTKELVIARRELDKQDAIEESRVNVLLRLSKERGKAATDQLAALESAGKIEQKITEDNIALKTKELALIDDKIKAAGKAKTAELKADKAAKELEIIQAQTQQDEVNAKIRVRESVFREKLRADAAAAAQKAREDAVRAKITLAEELLLRTDKDTAAEVAVRQRLVQLGADLEIVSSKKTAEEKRLIQAKANVEIQKLADDFNQKALDKAKKATDDTEKERLREYNEAKKDLEDYINTKRAAIDNDLADGLIGENIAQKQRNELDKAGLAAELVNAKDYAQDQGAILRKQSDNELREARRVSAEKRKIKEVERDIAQAAVDAGLAASDAVISAYGAESDAGRAALVVKKTLAIADIGINLQKQLSNNAVTGTEISKSIPPPIGPILGTAYVITTDALAVVSAGAATAKVLGFNTGGLVPGSGSTDTVPAMLTPGEVVMNQVASQQFLPVLSYLNTLAGGASFGPSLSASRSAGQIDGGLTSRSLGNSVFPTAAEIGAAVGQNVPTSIQVDAINAANGRKQRARALTSLG